MDQSTFLRDNGLKPRVMRTAILFAVMLSLPVSAVLAADEALDAKVETVVFVGSLLSIEELPDPCGPEEDCISMDSLYRARYEVVQPIVGKLPGREISFGIADHYGFPPFARYRNALLFVGMYEDGPWLHKYQAVAVHRTVDDQWASCGEVEYRDKGEPPSPIVKPLQFQNEITGTGELSEAGWRETLRDWRTSHDQLDHRITDGKVWCTRGVELPDIYEVMRNGALQARGVVLPAWSEAGQDKP